MTTPIGVHGLLAFRAAGDRPGVAARLAAGLGATPYTREDLAWSEVQPTSTTSWSWASTDAWVTDCANAGLSIFAILNKPPTWATGGASTTESWPRPPITEPATSQYAAFCGQVAARYGPGGTFWVENPTIPALPVTKFEVWNEPYKRAAWKDATGGQLLADVAAYGRMVTAAAAAIHNTPGCEVFGAVDTGTDNTADSSVVPFLIPLLDEPGVLAALDGLSVHPYPWNYQPATYNPVNTPRAAHGVEWRKSYAYVTKVEDVRATIAAYGRPAMPLWVTEVGYPTHLTGTAAVLGTTQAVAEAQQAQRVRSVFTWARQRQNLIQGLIFYTWQTPSWLSDQPSQPGFAGTDPERFYGLVHNDGSGGYGDGTTATVKPAWDALAEESAVGI